MYRALPIFFVIAFVAMSSAASAGGRVVYCRGQRVQSEWNAKPFHPVGDSIELVGLSIRPTAEVKVIEDTFADGRDTIRFSGVYPDVKIEATFVFFQNVATLSGLRAKSWI